ncbi:hypothetical protein Tco_1150013, partial [Tanacetum coccineum]
MSPIEHDILQGTIEELLRKGVIQKSKSLCAVPALLVPKKDKMWRMCIDSRAINKITVKYRFPIPRLDDTLDMLHRYKVFSKIVFVAVITNFEFIPEMSGRLLLRKKGLYECLVMPFGLSNAPSMLSRLVLMNPVDEEKNLESYKNANTLFEVFMVGNFLGFLELHGELHDLVPLPKIPGYSIVAENFTEKIEAIQVDVRLKLEASNAKYRRTETSITRPKIFAEGDLVM